MDRIEKAIKDFSYKTLDGVLNTLPPAPASSSAVAAPEARQVATSKVLDAVRTAQAAVGLIPINQPPAAQEGLLAIVNKAFDDGKAQVDLLQERTEPAAAIAQLKAAPAMLANVTGTVLENIQIARMQKMRGTPPNEMTPFSTIFLNILPELAKNQSFAGQGIAFATNPLGKLAIKRFAPGIILKAVEEQNLSAEQKAIIKAALPVAIEILAILDLTGPAAQGQIQKITDLLRLVTTSITS